MQVDPAPVTEHGVPAAGVDRRTSSRTLAGDASGAEDEPAGETLPGNPGVAGGAWAGQSGQWNSVRGPPSEVAASLSALSGDAQQFAVWDYDPGVLAATSCAVSAGAFISGCFTVSGHDALGGSALQRFLHGGLLLVHSALCAGTVLVLRTRGPHVRYIVNNYQQLAACYLTLVFYMALAESVLREERNPAWISRGEKAREAREATSIDTCLLAGYTVVLASARLHWEWVVMAVGVDLAGVVLAGIWVGLSPSSMQRVFASLVLCGGCATYLSFNRISHSRLQFESLQRIRALATRSAEFLCTLIPSRVVERAHLVSNFGKNSKAKAKGHRRNSDAAELRTEGQDGEHKSSQDLFGIASGFNLELQEKLDDVLMMFCSLPPLDTFGTNIQAFALLNQIFSAFDDEVRRFRMFKYHHMFNTYIVASPRAALSEKYKDVVDEHAAMLALAVRLKAIASHFSNAAGDPLWLAIGMDIGNMVGKIVGLEKSFWCLFGPAINVAARLSHITGRDRLYESCIAVITKEVAERFQVVRNKIANGTHRSSDGKGNADDSGTESLTGLSPGFAINVLGLRNIKGQGELLLYSVAESITADATPNTLTPFESGASADETQDIPRYTGSFRLRARSGLIGPRTGSMAKGHSKSPRASFQNMVRDSRESMVTSGSRRRLCKFGDSYTEMDHVAEEESLVCTPQSSTHTMASSTVPEGLMRENSTTSAGRRYSEDDGGPAVDADKAADGSPPTHTFLDIAKKWNDAKAGLHLQGSANHDKMIQDEAGTSQLPSGSEDDSGAGQLISLWTRKDGLVQGSNSIMVPLRPPSASGSSRGASEGGSRRSLSKRSCKSSISSSKSSSNNSSKNSSKQNSRRCLNSSAGRLLALDIESTHLIEEKGDSDGGAAPPSTPMNEPQPASLNEPGAPGHLDADPGAQSSERQAEAHVDVDVQTTSWHKQYMLRMEGFRTKSRPVRDAWWQNEHPAQNPMVHPHGQHDRDRDMRGSMRMRSSRRRSHVFQGSDSEDPTYPISRRDYPFSYRAMRRLNKCARPGFMAESEYDSRESDNESGDSSADAKDSWHETGGQMSPRSLLLREAEMLQMEAMARARNAFRNLGLKKINERSKYSNSRSKRARGGDTKSRSREERGGSKEERGSSGLERESGGGSKSCEGSTNTSADASLSGSRSSSFRNSRRFDGKNSNSQSSFITISESGAGTTSTSTSEGFAGSFRSLLNDSFKQNILYGNSFQLLELEDMLNEQFPVHRNEVLSGSSDEASHTSSYVRRAVYKNEQKFRNRRTCWIEKILSSQNSLNRTHRTENTNGSSNNTQSSTGRLLAGEVEWFNEDSLHHIDSKEIKVAGPFWHQDASAWHQNPLMTGTNASQSLSGFGKSEASFGGGAFSSSLKRLYGLISFSQTNTPAVSVLNTPQHSDSEAARANSQPLGGTSQPSDSETARELARKRSTSPQQIRRRKPETKDHHSTEYPSTGQSTDASVDCTSPDRAAAARDGPKRSDGTMRGGNAGATDKNSPERTAHSPPAPDRTLVVARSSPASGPGWSGSDSSDASQHRMKEKGSRGRGREYASRSGREVKEKAWSVSGEDRSQDSTDERRFSQERQERHRRQSEDALPPIGNTGREDSEVSCSTGTSLPYSCDSSRPPSMSRENSFAGTSFAGSGNSLTQVFDLAPRGSFVIRRHPLSPDTRREKRRGIHNETDAPIPSSAYADKLDETDKEGEKEHSVPGKGAPEHKRSGRSSKSKQQRLKNKQAKKKRRDETTFRIVLPNGSHLSGLSKQTFGHRDRMQVGTDEYVLREYQIDNVWLDFVDREQNQLFLDEHCSTSSYMRRVLVGGFGVLFIFIGINAHGLFDEPRILPRKALDLDSSLPWSAAAAPGAGGVAGDVAGRGKHRGGGGGHGLGQTDWPRHVAALASFLPFELAANSGAITKEVIWGWYLMLVASALICLLAGLALTLFVQMRDSNALDAETRETVPMHAPSHRSAAAHPGLSINVICRIFRVLLTLLRVVYVGVSLVASLTTGETLWTVDFCLSALACACMGNGMFTREITLVLLVGHVTLFPCMYHSWEHSPIRYIEIVNQILLSVLAYYSTRIETAGNLSTWIGLQLLAKQRSRMAEILKHLLPQDMVEMVLSIHFKTGNEALPITLCRESRAIVLHLDLKNYTGLAARLEPDRLAEHINEIFKSFDRLVYSSESKAHGLFKIDTIGDAYEAAAWLSEPTEDSTEEELTRLRQRDAEVCAKMVKVGWSMIEAVTKYAAEQESKIECRIGIAYGQVLAGMLGKLQPRFHLMGEAVWDAHKLESSAETNTLRVSEDVQQLLADFLPSLIHVQRDKESRDVLVDGASEPDPSNITNIGLHRRKKKNSKAREGRGQKEGRGGGGSRGSKESKLATQSMSEVPEAQAQDRVV